MKKKTIEDMSIYEISRWGALLKAIEIIEENCQTLKKDFDDLDLKPIAIKHYINSLANNIEIQLEKVLKNDQKTNKTFCEELITKKIVSSYEESDVLLNNNV